MRILVIYFLIIFFTDTGFGQAGIGTQTPASTALLDVTATNKGFLPPRMTPRSAKPVIAIRRGEEATVSQYYPCYFYTHNVLRWKTNLKFEYLLYVLPAMTLN